MESSKSVGRPRRGYTAKYCTYYIPEHIIAKLNTYPNKTEIVIKSLENYFEIDGKSQEWVRKRIQEIDTEKVGLLKILELEQMNAEKERTKNLKDEQELLSRFQRLLKRLENSKENLQPYPKNNLVASTLKITFTDMQYSKICSAFDTDKLTFDYFKSVLDEK